MKEKSCTKSCLNGNPYRGYLCQCTACKGGAHGAVKIDVPMIEEFLHRSLSNPEIGKADARLYENLLAVILDHKPARRRLRVAR